MAEICAQGVFVNTVLMDGLPHLADRQAHHCVQLNGVKLGENAGYGGIFQVETSVLFRKLCLVVPVLAVCSVLRLLLGGSRLADFCTVLCLAGGALPAPALH